MHFTDSRQTVALTIAGSDSGGNAGVQADLRAFHTYGLHGCTVFTALTAQNPFAVTAVEVPGLEFLEAQLDAVLQTYSIGAAKTGMLATRQVIEAVAAKLAKYPDIPVVVDPVMIATSGARLIQEDAIAAMRDCLLPRATIATPNLPEAEELCGNSITSPSEMLAAARTLAKRADCAILVKGGHAAGTTATDFLAFPDGTAVQYRSPLVEHPCSTHGTGCSLSAAIAAGIARGLSIRDAVALGKTYVYEAIRQSLPVGPRATVLGTPSFEELLQNTAVETTDLGLHSL